VNHTTKIVAKNFAKQFVDLRFFRFAFQTFAKLSFYHRKHGFDVRAFMVKVHKLASAHLEKVIHLAPKFIACGVVGSATFFERSMQKDF
jgi:hypothetical protein